MDWKNEIKYWQSGASNFRSLLFTLIQKADQENLARIREGFPDQVAAFEAWMSEGDAAFETEAWKEQIGGQGS